MPQHHYLFRVGAHDDSPLYRLASGTTVSEACLEAFGVDYTKYPTSTVVYKDLGTRSPKYASQATKRLWYGPTGWTPCSTKET